jgi:hypothetical protein
LCGTEDAQTIVDHEDVLGLTLIGCGLTLLALVAIGFSGGSREGLRSSGVEEPWDSCSRPVICG